MERKNLKLTSPQSDSASPKMPSLGSWFNSSYSLVLRLTTNKICNKNTNILANFSYVLNEINCIGVHREMNIEETRRQLPKIVLDTAYGHFMAEGMELKRNA